MVFLQQVLRQVLLLVFDEEVILYVRFLHFVVVEEFRQQDLRRFADWGFVHLDVQLINQIYLLRVVFIVLRSLFVEG